MVTIFSFTTITTATTTAATVAAPIISVSLAKVCALMVVEKGNLMGLLQIKWSSINVSNHLESGHSEGREEDEMIKSDIS
jgi:hypothetical protein